MQRKRIFLAVYFALEQIGQEARDRDAAEARRRAALPIHKRVGESFARRFNRSKAA